MTTKTITERAKVLLTLVEALVETPGLTWVDASNAVFAPRGPFGCLFHTEAERVAFGKTKERRRIDKLIWSLPEPPLRPEPKEEYSGKRAIEIIQIPPRRGRSNTGTRKAVNGRPSGNGAEGRHAAQPIGKKSH